MRSNVKTKLAPVFTHEGGKAQRVSPLKELARSVGTCMLFENTFYDKGSTIADRIASLCPKVSPQDLFLLTLGAREEMKLRHVPLFLILQYLNHPGKKVTPGRDLIASVIKRPDEMGELISIYWRNGKKPLPAQMKKGLAQTFHSFNEFKFAKWNSTNDAIRLRDVMFMVHPKPLNEREEILFKKIANDQLETPETWETELSAGKDKKATWTKLLREGKIGVMAFLMNLRNMKNADVDVKLITEAWQKLDKKWALPFRYITASRHAPWFVNQLNDGFSEAIAGVDALEGSTYVIVDTSGSMIDRLSHKSDTTRRDAAASLAAIVRGICPDSRVFWFSDRWGEVPNYTGLPLVQSFDHLPSGGTYLRRAVSEILAKNGIPERIIVLTDEQSQDGLCELPRGVKGYLVNLAPYQYGVENKGGWINVNGFSERIIDWIRFEEELEVAE